MGELLIERIPIEDYERVLPQKSFPRMPILYLELLENKTKVRKDLLNKLHKPPPPKPEPEPEPTRDTSFEQFQSSHAEEQVVDSSGAGDGEGDEDSGEKIIEDQLNTLLGEDKSQAASAPEPPTLQELQQKKKVTINNSYNYVEEDEETQKERNTVYFKYEVLRRMHPNASTLYSDPKLMSQKYEMLTKKLSLDSVENWKRYMIVFVMGCEVALGKVTLTWKLRAATDHVNENIRSAARGDGREELHAVRKQVVPRDQALHDAHYERCPLRRKQDDLQEDRNDVSSRRLGLRFRFGWWGLVELVEHANFATFWMTILTG